MMQIIIVGKCKQQNLYYTKKQKFILFCLKEPMKISEDLNCFREKNFFNDQQRSARKNSNQHQQFPKPNSNIAMFSTPFRMKNNKYIEQTPVFVKSQNKNHRTEIMVDVSKQFSPYSSAKSKGMGQLEKKFLEDNLERWQKKQQLQSKKKSVSYRIHIPSKQTNFINNNLQKQVKANTHQVLPSQYDQRRRHQNKTQMDRKTPLLNRQKSSQSFIIKKKFNTNVELLKPEQQKLSNRFTYKMQKFKKEHFAEEDNLKDFLKTPSQDVGKSQQSSKNHERIHWKNEHKQVKQKEHHLKAGRSLKVKVNKLLKQQQNLFKKGLSAEKQQYSNNKIIFKTQHHEHQIQALRYHTNQQIELAALQKSVKMVKSPYDMEGNHQKGENSIIIDHGNIKGETTQSSEEVLRSSSNVDSEKKIDNNSNLLRIKNQRQHENASTLQNRKSKISSIRAIKNYIKKLDKQERSPCPPQQKDRKQIGSVKKREKQTVCLTHKIKWGNPSKKKLSSGQGIYATQNQFFQQCSVERNIKSEIKRFQIQKHPRIEEKQDEQMITIEAKLKDHKIKKKQLNRVQFQQDQSKSPKKSTNNPEKELTKPQKNEQSLVNFDDSGISLIANNNDSIHIADTRLILPSFEKLSFQAIEMIDNSMISPVHMMKRVKQDPVEEKMESLQELYSQLRSHKQKPVKNGNQLLRLNSIEEFFQKQ